MNRHHLYYIFCLIISLSFLSCESEKILPDPEPEPDPEPISYSIKVECSFSEIDDLSLTWEESDATILATAVVSDKLKEITFSRDYLSDDKKKAWFYTNLDFIPASDIQWTFAVPSSSKDFKAQDGKIESLRHFSSFSGEASGSSPKVSLEGDLNILRIFLPAGVQKIECQGGFDVSLELNPVSAENDIVYFAIPNECSSPIIVTALDAQKTEFRRDTVSNDFKQGISDIIDCSIVEPDPIEFLFRVECSLSDIGGLPAIWDERDSFIQATTSIEDSIVTMSLVRDSLSDDKSKAWFSKILDFEPTEAAMWSFLIPASAQDYSNQEGTVESLRSFANLSANGIGLSPIVSFENDLKVLRITMPEGASNVTCQGGFSASIDLESTSKENDLVYFAIPHSCSSPIVVSAKKDNGTVFRSATVQKDFSVGASNVFDCSIVKRSNYSAEAKTSTRILSRGNYSGITRIEGNKYAVVSDGADTEGWFEFEIPINDQGEIEYVSKLDYISVGHAQRDLEDITYNPSTNRMWLTAEDDNIITEHYLTGERTGNTLSTSMFVITIANYGLESLTYNDVAKRYWTTTETTMSLDGWVVTPYSKRRQNTLRLQSYFEDGSVGDWWYYKTDSIQKTTTGFAYAFGVPALCALDDGRLLVLEREFFIDLVVGEVGFSYEKIFIVDPTSASAQTQLDKKLLVEFKNKLTLSVNPAKFTGNCVNYEGMCLGPTLPDGSRVVLLVSDSQDNMCLSEDDTSFTFRDTFTPIVLRTNPE